MNVAFALPDSLDILCDSNSMTDTKEKEDASKLSSKRFSKIEENKTDLG